MTKTQQLIHHIRRKFPNAIAHGFIDALGFYAGDAATLPNRYATSHTLAHSLWAVGARIAADYHYNADYDDLAACDAMADAVGDGPAKRIIMVGRNDDFVFNPLIVAAD